MPSLTVPSLWIHPYKLIPPRAPEPVLARERLESQLDQAWSYPLTLVQGPPGQGKTTLLVHWLQSRAPRCAWVSLDEGDNQLQHFAAHLVYALHQAQAPGCPASLALVEAGEFQSFDSLLAKVSIELSRLPGHLYLILDDFQVITHPELLQAIRQWLRFLPPNVHLMLGCHQEPAIGISALRVRGQVLVVDAPQLAFTHDEAQAFLQARLNQPVSTELVDQLSTRLNGWPAGFQLTTSQQRTEQALLESSQRLGGPYHLVFDFIRDEVLPALSTEMRQLLLQICVFDRFDAELCRFMTTQDDVATLLGELVHAHLFVHPDAEDQAWYRLHDVFREVLRTLSQADPRNWHDIQLKAVHAYLATGRDFEALALAMTLPDRDALEQVLHHAGERFYRRGQFDVLEQALQQLDDSALLANPDFLLLRLWTYLASYRETEIKPLLQRAEDHGLLADSAIRAEFQVVLAQEAINREAFAEARVLASDALQYLPESSRVSRTVAWSVLGQSDLCEGRLNEALASLQAAEHQAVTSKLAQQQLWSLCLQSDTLSDQGKLDDALAVQTRAMAMAGEKCIERVLHMEFLYRNRALALLERLALDETRHYIDQALAVMQPLGDYGLTPAFTIKGRLHLLVGEMQQARQIGFHLRHLKNRYAYHTDWQAHLLQFELLLWAEQNRDGPAPDIDEAILARPAHNHFVQSYQRQVAHLWWLQGQEEAAVARLHQLDEQALEHGLLLESVRNRLYLAAFEPEQNWLQRADLQQELQRLKPLFTLWVHRRALLPQLAGLSSFEGWVRTIDQLSLKQDQPASGTPWVSRLNANLSADSEPLTPKEIRVLTSIVEGFNNQEIARQMFVAPSTVKSHIRRIYRKLGVNDREAAMAFARPYFEADHGPQA